VIAIERAVDLAGVRELILEYASGVGVDLSFQHFDEEMQTLESYYEVIFRRARCRLRRVAADRR
jgi:hypothetical protein